MKWIETIARQLGRKRPSPSAFKIRHLAPWLKRDIVLDDLHFSGAFTIEEADALLCEWAPLPELLTFPRRKAWCCLEATSYAPFKTPEWRRYREALAPDEFLYHAHPDPNCRVPPFTHVSSRKGLEVFLRRKRSERAVAVVSNVAGPPSARGADAALRIRYVTHPSVDLFGRRKAWAAFQMDDASPPGPPANYKGELAGYWAAGGLIRRLSRYKVSVCLENTTEPNYFTEKFVNAVRAGCIPVYYAEPSTVRNGILRGARWVDPADFAFDVAATIDQALKGNLEDHWAANATWLSSDAVLATSSDAVFRRIGRILQGTTSLE